MLGWEHSPVPSLPSRNLTLATAVKNHAKMNVKLFFFCPVLLDFPILFQIPRPRLQATRQHMIGLFPSWHLLVSFERVFQMNFFTRSYWKVLYDVTISKSFVNTEKYLWRSLLHPQANSITNVSLTLFQKKIGQLPMTPVLSC